MRHLTGLLTVLVLSTFLLLPSTTRAADLVITSGSLSVTGITGGPVFSFAGEGLIVASTGGVGQVQAAHQCRPCFAGDRVWLLSRFEDILGSGPATVNGVNYERLNYFGSLVPGTNTFVMVPAPDLPTGSSVFIDEPFTLGGTLRGVTPSTLGVEIFNMGMSGQGTATLQLIAGEFNAARGLREYNFQSVTYTFSEPIPEPATMLLLGTGLAGLVAAVRRHRKADKRDEA